MNTGAVRSSDNPELGGERTKPRLLFLSQNLPFPPDGGAQIRTFNVMRLLADTFDVTALCFFRRADRPGVADVDTSLAALRRFAEVEAFPIPQEHWRLRLLWDHARSALRKRPYTNYMYESRPFREGLTRLLCEREFDVVHVDSLDLSVYLPMLEAIPVVCTHHNVESTLLRRRAALAGSPLAGKYLVFQAGFTEAEERHWCAEVALNVVVSSGDADRLREIAPSARIRVVPNGVDTELFRPSAVVPYESGVVFVGGYNWYPNRDAMAYFAHDILPLLKRDVVDVAVTWIGRAPVDRAEYERLGLSLTGYVADIRPYLERAACYIVPLRVGGGTRLKILDAWAMGKAVVSTAIGCEGLEAVDGENILIRDDPFEFAAAVRAVLTDDGLRARLSANARRTAVRVYDWEVIGRAMLEMYVDVATAGGDVA